MNNFYLFVPSTSEQLVSAPEKNHRTTIKVSDSNNPVLNAGDKILLTHLKGGDYEGIAPGVSKVVRVNQQAGTFVLETEKNYNKKVPIGTVRSLLKRPLGVGMVQLAQAEFDAIIGQMGGILLEERELLEHIKHYIDAKGYYFDDETIYNYHVCLKTRPFVILAGLSGTGKSKLSQLYAEALGHKVQNKRYLRLAVRPGWNDDRFLLGYLNSITGEYVTEPAVDFMIRAEEDRDNLYFFCLDEMNLAHVEYYFSQFLSALEEEEFANRQIPLLSDAIQARLEKQGKNVGVPSSIMIPPNLLFTGTINVDETTQPLSDKVIDRANTIEFFAVDLDKIPERKPLPEQITISAPAWQSYIAHKPDASYRSQIIEIGKILNKADLGLGYRILREIELYLANSKDLLQSAVAFDLQVKQRILPRVRGTEAIHSVLDDLSTFMKKNNLVRSEKRLDEMKFRLKRDGYTSFWR
jgi:5-methylcytosine-specific restriction endonuclease McrBC GTP-binding regulatory subunit McrB